MPAKAIRAPTRPHTAAPASTEGRPLPPPAKKGFPLWTLAIVWYIRRADELQEEGHRLLWLWVPCAATAIGAWPTPIVNLVLGG